MQRARLVFLLLTSFALALLDSAESLTSESGDQCDELLDFENRNQLNCFATRGDSTKSLSEERAKNGLYSLKWESKSTGRSRLVYTRPSSSSIRGKKLRYGGMKIWLYKERESDGKMEIRLRDSNKKKTIGLIPVDLGFKGWRGIWVAYSECKTSSRSIYGSARLDRVSFVISQKDTIFIDILDFVDNLAFQSRDKIVPPFTTKWKVATSSRFQTYRWSKQKPTDLPKAVDASKTLSLKHIESRFKNFYCNEKKTSYDFVGFELERWKAMTKSFGKANKEYDRLTFKTLSDSKKVISGPPLFCRTCKRGTRKYSTKDPTRKFSFVMAQIMLPLAVEYYLRSRKAEMDKIVEKETTNQALLSTDPAKVEESVKRIAGNHKARRDEFYSFLQNQQKVPYDKTKVRRSLEYLNKALLQRIINLLDYVEDQGWADGSALGSLTAEMNRNGAAYMHTILLLKDSLHKHSTNKSRLLSLIKTAKWYNDFGEVYQKKFEFDGINADRMITIMLFRLIIVLVMPTSSDAEKKARQRDMDACKKWMDNALKINKAFGGVVKPDYTGFHHKAFYGSAYIPQALHTASQLQYLLEGTDFALSDSSKRNLRESLKTLRVIAVKYSTPSSVGGRFPQYSKAVLLKTIPAYAYISVSHSGSLASTPKAGASVPDVTSDVKMFIRLYQPSDELVVEYLNDGTIRRGKSYMNTLGSLEIMSQVFQKASVNKKMTAESSPEGHWSKNFAALSIHRREDWAVTMKGFNRFVWDFEQGKGQNLHGIFQSHGQMIIANNEESLKAHDIENGWDWTKIPGATTMNLSLYETLLKKARYFSPRSSAGGVTFKGPEPIASGLFAMDFHQPDYQFLNVSDRHRNIKLYFKKSVFFFQSVLVCLGSNIKIENGPGKEAQTTLFQDKLQRGSSTFTIEVDGVTKGMSAPFPAETPALSSEGYITLTDTKGNSYYIPSSSASSLKVKVENQSSKTPADKPSSGYYATAWFEHSSSDDKYEYAIYVKTPSYPKSASNVWKSQATSTTRKVYTVLKQDNKAHVVKFEMTTERWNWIDAQYGYAIFGSIMELPAEGPIKAVSKDCLIMAKEDSKFLYLSISYPDLAFPTSKPLEKIQDIKVKEEYKMESEDTKMQVALRYDVLKTLPTKAYAHGSPSDYLPIVRVESLSSPKANKGNRVVFDNLKNGFSVEVKLRKYSE